MASLPPKQQLYILCGKLGWSTRYFFSVEHEGTDAHPWAVEVRTGIGAAASHTFVSDCINDNTNTGLKAGHAAAAALAVRGLDAEAQRQLAFPAASMDATLGAHFDATVTTVEAEGRCAGAGWAAFWAQKPKVVGIDVEGNLHTPPVLVQVATISLVILEAPGDGRGGGRFSSDLLRLLADESILKVFCDGSSEADKRCLNLPSSDDARRDLVDLEDLAATLAGPGGVRRGLARILGLALPWLPVRISKEEKKAQHQRSSQFRNPSVMFFAAIDKGDRPSFRGGLHQIPAEMKRYGALDAWCTLLAWRGLTAPEELSAEMHGWMTVPGAGRDATGRGGGGSSVASGSRGDAAGCNAGRGGGDYSQPLWVAHQSPEGYVYYHNTTSGVTRWDKPTAYRYNPMA
mmetsp:Transcript_8088/g.20070  ORF Transcript_8088/g.20070 Transcript_8088/m.20070 type:complete len:402 (-) Transcript_8088:585-1790(-)